MLLTPNYSLLLVGEVSQEVLAEEGRLEEGEAIALEEINCDNTDTKNQTNATD